MLTSGTLFWSFLFCPLNNPNFWLTQLVFTLLNFVFRCFLSSQGHYTYFVIKLDIISTLEIKTLMHVWLENTWYWSWICVNNLIKRVKRLAYKNYDTIRLKDIWPTSSFFFLLVICNWLSRLLINFWLFGTVKYATCNHFSI